MRTLALLFLTAVPLLAAQEEENQAKYRAKLAEAFVAKIDWVQSFAEAQRQAKEKRMLIFGYFTRSYAP